MEDDYKMLSVSEINRYIKTLMDYDEVLSDLLINGEISNFKRHSSGHLYFSLKDDSSRISCVMFRQNALYLDFTPADGMHVKIRGKISVYEKTGAYQIYVHQMQKYGLGELYEQYQLLLKELSEQGYFEEAKKKPIPFLPKKIALITSPTSAAVRDMISVIKRRCPISQIIVCPVLVQGDSAAPDIAQMIRRVNDINLADVILLARGGGSIEELWAFNERIVAESIYKSHIPVISGVGHETDFTVADFVSDKRAPTPSVAAELAVPDINKILSSLQTYKTSMYESVLRKITKYKEELFYVKEMKVFKNPNSIFENRYLEIDRLYEKINDQIFHKLQILGTKTNSMAKVLESLSYENVLKRGFFAVSKNGVFVKDNEISVDDMIKICGENSEIDCTVTGRREKTNA